MIRDRLKLKKQKDRSVTFKVNNELIIEAELALMKLGKARSLSDLIRACLEQFIEEEQNGKGNK